MNKFKLVMFNIATLSAEFLCFFCFFFLVYHLNLAPVSTEVQELTSTEVNIQLFQYSIIVALILHAILFVSLKLWKVEV